MQKKRASLTDLLLINAYWVGLSFKWNSLHVLILPAVLLNFVPENLKNTYLGLLTFVGLVIAMFLQPVSGAWSDRWRSPFGRRRPLMFIGTAFDFVFLAILGWSGGLLWLALGYIGLQVSSNTAHGPAQGLIADIVPPQQHGAASGVKNLMDMSGLVISSLLIGQLLDPATRHPLVPMLVVGFFVLLATAITLLGVREAPSMPDLDEAQPARQTRRSSILESIRSIHPAYRWLIASRFIFLLGIYDIQVFAQYYIRDVLKVANPVALTGNLLSAITLALIAFALAGGWLGDRFGHKRVLYLASVIGSLGCLLLLMARTPQKLLFFGAVLGVGIGLFLTSNWALANTHAPLGSAGKYLGMTNLATAGAGAVGRLGGPMIDLLNNASPGAYHGYMAMFVFGAACSLLSVLLLRRVG
jgi:MFS family permease